MTMFLNIIFCYIKRYMGLYSGVLYSGAGGGYIRRAYIRGAYTWNVVGLYNIRGYLYSGV
jgi:hypothetical protein